MDKLIDLLITCWFWLAIGMSLFWGIRAPLIFEKNRGFGWKSYQFIFNFVGSFAGWVCFYALLIRFKNNMPTCRGFTGGDIILFVISLLALTGHLPQVIYGVIQSLDKIAKAAIEKIYTIK